MVKVYTYNLNVFESGKLVQQRKFKDKLERQNYLMKVRKEACHKKLQHTYKTGEYLRIYRNSIIYKEYDIKNVSTLVEAKAALDAIFKR